MYYTRPFRGLSLLVLVEGLHTRPTLCMCMLCGDLRGTAVTYVPCAASVEVEVASFSPVRVCEGCGSRSASCFWEGSQGKRTEWLPRLSQLAGRTLNRRM